MKKFVCVEHGEVFVIDALSLNDAKEGASLYGGEAIRELTPEEYASQDEKGGYKIDLRRKLCL